MSYVTLLGKRVTVQLTAKKNFVGIVYKVGDDYILLVEDTIGNMILPLEHVKLMRVDLNKTQSAKLPQNMKHEKLNPDTIPDKLSDVFKQLRHTVVQLEGGGPDPAIGYIIEAKDDYLTICVIPDGIVYFPLCHVLAALALDVKVQPEFAEWVNQHIDQLFNAEHFNDVLHHEIGKLVKLGRGGVEDVSGILKHVDLDYVEIVVSPYENVLVPSHHVKAIARIVRFEWPPAVTPIS